MGSDNLLIQIRCPEQIGAGDHCAYQHAEDAMRIDVLPCQVEAGELGALRHVARHAQRDVFGDAVGATLRCSRVVEVGERG